MKREQPRAGAAAEAGLEPPVLPYQEALDRFRRGGADEASLLQRVSELVSLVDLVSVLGSTLGSEQILDAALLIVMGQLQCRRGALFVRTAQGTFELRAGRGLPPGVPREVPLDLGDGELLQASPDSAPVLTAFDLDVLCPVVKAGQPIAALGLGGREGQQPYGRDESAFLRTVAACAAAPLENALMHEELRRLTQRLSLKVFQLHSLFDISRELTATLDEDAILQVASAALMGHLMASRCAVYLPSAEGLEVVHQRGVRVAEEHRRVPAQAARAGLDVLRAPLPVEALPPGPLREALSAASFSLAIPLGLAEPAEGVVAVGQRPSGAPYSAEDHDFALTLARQVAAALQTVRLHQVRVQKERQDRELQIARGIQQGLFPRERPQLPGFDLAASSVSCYEVGGDHYDFIPFADGRWALAVADVSGKGTPSSILMASVHAWLRAAAGTTSAAMLMGRLNRFLCRSTEAHRYVTLFYAELDPAGRRLSYVNGGHVPGFLARASGECERLREGGPALGFIEEAVYQAGEVVLEDGDLLALVTDGVTEASDPQEVEFEPAVPSLLASARGAGASEVLDRLLLAVERWVGAPGCADDVTALILKALPRS